MSEPPTRPASQFWTVSSGDHACELSLDGMCVSDGVGDYSVGERCTVRAEVDIVVSAQTLLTQSRVTIWSDHQQHRVYGHERAGERDHERGVNAVLGE